jgi:adenylate kinase family enzyme
VSKRILITGASGSGTSTLGRAVAAALQAAFVDADDLFWLPSDPPFRAERNAAERAGLLREHLRTTPSVVVSGSIYGWGAELEDAFDLVIFLRAPSEVRVARLRERELRLLGQVDEAFIAWAAQYDAGDMPGRSLARHLTWLESRTCPVLRLSGTDNVEALRASVLAATRTGHS